VAFSNKTGKVFVMQSSECGNSDLHVEPLFHPHPPITVATMGRSAQLPKAVLEDGNLHLRGKTQGEEAYKPGSG
jgi:hypothetical protein